MSASSGFYSLFFSGGSGQHCPWIAFADPSSILPGMDPYHRAAVCSSAHQPHHAALGESARWRKSPAGGSLPAPSPEGQGPLLDLSA